MQTDSKSSRDKYPRLERAAVVAGVGLQGVLASQCLMPQLKPAAVVAGDGQLGMLASRCQMLGLKLTAVLAGSMAGDAGILKSGAPAGASCCGTWSWTAGGADVPVSLTLDCAL